MSGFVVGSLGVMAFLAIALEEQLHLQKWKSSMVFGLGAWVLLFVEGHSLGEETFTLVEYNFDETVLEIAKLWLFLISAMSFIAYLDKRGFIGNAIVEILPKEISMKAFLGVMMGFTFIFSGVADNLTATLVSLSIILSVMKKSESNDLLKMGVAIVFAANAGGLPLITGDVTTLMVFHAGKIEMDKLLILYIPALTTTSLLFLVLQWGMKGKMQIQKGEEKLSSTDTKIAVLFGVTIIGILLGHIYYNLPPVLVFLFGLSVMFVFVAHENRWKKTEIQMLDYIRHMEFDTLFFFLGVLLIVGAVKEVGLLENVAIFYDKLDPTLASTIVGMISAVVDNIPITAALLKSKLSISQQDYMVLTYAVGIGGSILSIGSAAGVVAMSKLGGVMTFGSYLKYAPIIFFIYVFDIIVTHMVA